MLVAEFIGNVEFVGGEKVAFDASTSVYPVRSNIGELDDPFGLGCLNAFFFGLENGDCPVPPNSQYAACFQTVELAVSPVSTQ